MLRILQGDALEQLPRLPAQSVQCCVTSPPYWGLRDYGTAQWVGGEMGCEHIPDAETLERQNGRASTLIGITTSQKMAAIARYKCKCGARRIDAQLGLEATPQENIEKMVAVFREVKRVLRDDGTLWLNLGDSYAGLKVGNTNAGPSSGLHKDGRAESSRLNSNAIRSADMEKMSFKKELPPGLKPKDLCGIPWRLALALQADGWYLRSDIIWHKPNPMPESVTDRPTKSHEYIFLLTKSERYFYDAEAIREPATEPRRQSSFRGGSYCDHSSFNNSDKGITKTPLHSFNLEPRNKRSVWTIATQPYAEAHFATFPEEIPKLAILAGSKRGDTVLDPFAGSGTVGQVALELGRRAVLIELNPEYVRLIEDRTRVTPGMF